MVATSVTDFQITGILCLVLYLILALATASRLYLHIRHSSGTPRVVFHVVLLMVVLFSMPKPIVYICAPTTEMWIMAFITSLCGMLLLNMALSYVCVEWSAVASTGRTIGRLPADHGPLRTIVIVANVGVLAWAAVTCFSIVSFPDTTAGEDAFYRSALCASLVVVGSLIFLATTFLLMAQGLKIRSRLLESQRFVSQENVQRSMVKLVLSVSVITLTTWVRLTFNLLAVFGVAGFADMPLLPYEVWSNLVPTVFPVLCLLYLQRRLPLEPTDTGDGCAMTTLPTTMISTIYANP
ncbi:hypothetical protein H310_07555 [Aphanomyces invadans]|nr:hypothetical protein H310_07555 [Aphanomyces invadans]ETW00148.1 hypothetical protein H310_07555 [Aphanomyces invadans]|eukprot:XP_008871173.1 hypothetical protein H310_07555 [Aphanomyces invadans]